MRLLSSVLPLFGCLSVLATVDNNKQTPSIDVKNHTSDTEHQGSTNFCKMDKGQLIGTTCGVTFHEINQLNNKIRQDLKKLVTMDFFKYFKLDLYRKCPFWDNHDSYCFNRACAVDIIENWDSLPEMWQPEVLGGLEGGETQTEDDDDCAFLNDLCANSGPALEFLSDINYCDVDDFNKKGSVLVDLTANPERFTGYGGEQSAQIWSAIYNENCFPVKLYGTSLAKDVFYRLISGLHASIGTHLSNDYLNTTTGEWMPNLELFMARVGNFPDRVTNIYFNYAIVGKALWKLKSHLKEIAFFSNQDEKVNACILNVLSQLDSKIFNEDLLFQDDLSSALKNEFRTRFKNVTRLMDCVHCDRCRMWGKVQTKGYATSLKILFEMDDAESRQNVVNNLTKYELIALFNTFDRISKSVESISKFESMYNERVNATSGTIVSFFQNNFFKILSMAGKSLSETSVSTRPCKVSQTLKTAVPRRHENKFQDLIFPKKRPNPTPSLKPEGKWQAAWRIELQNVKEALNFIWKSYISLPTNMLTLSLYYLGNWFNAFIGIPYYTFFNLTSVHESLNRL